MSVLKLVVSKEDIKGRFHACLLERNDIAMKLKYGLNDLKAQKDFLTI